MNQRVALIISAAAVLVFVTILATQNSSISNGTGGGNSTIESGVTGTVLLGPRCPVERIPPAPNCTDTGYQTAIDVHSGSVSGAIISSVATDAKGIFKISLQPGHFVLLTRGGTHMPRCRPQEVDIKAHQFQTVNLFCDTGIR